MVLCLVDRGAAGARAAAKAERELNSLMFDVSVSRQTLFASLFQKVLLALKRAANVALYAGAHRGDRDRAAGVVNLCATVANRTSQFPRRNRPRCR